MNFDDIKSVTTTIQSGINTTTRAAADLGLGGVGNPGTYWANRLRPASYRGVPFGVLSGESQFGRRNAVHQYPFRDTVWVEDLGRAARQIKLNGFLVENAEYGGRSSVIAQREQMIAACESPGEGELVHPTLGRLTVSNMAFSTEERWEQGRVFEISFAFIEAGKRIFPSVETSTGDAVARACNAADYAAAADFVASVQDPIKKGAAVVSQAVSTAGAWGRKAQALANDATNAFHMVDSLAGNLGRFTGATILVGAASAIAGSGQATVQQLIAMGSAVRVRVSAVIANLSTVSSSLGS
jgi:prophage DNA circulation protein